VHPSRQALPKPGRAKTPNIHNSSTKIDPVHPSPCLPSHHPPSRLPASAARASVPHRRRRCRHRSAPTRQSCRTWRYLEPSPSQPMLRPLPSVAPPPNQRPNEALTPPRASVSVDARRGRPSAPERPPRQSRSHTSYVFSRCVQEPPSLARGGPTGPVRQVRAGGTCRTRGVRSPPGPPPAAGRPYGVVPFVGGVGLPPTPRSSIVVGGGGGAAPGVRVGTAQRGGPPSSSSERVVRGRSVVLACHCPCPASSH